jgi:hypothetical protein
VATIPIITTGFLFRGLEKLFCRNIFKIFRVRGYSDDVIGCYIIFSGFSASTMSCIQKRKMYTTNVTVGTAGASKSKIRQGKHSWRRYLIAAPMAWLG